MLKTDARGERNAPTMPNGRAGYAMRGEGSVVVATSREDLWDLVMDEARLSAAIPGAETLRRQDVEGTRTYVADVKIGVGPVKGIYEVSVQFRECVPPAAAVLVGGAKGFLGRSAGEGWVDFEDVQGHAARTRVVWRYAVRIEGTVARVGGRMLDLAADKLIEKFFQRLAKSLAQGAATKDPQNA